MQKNRKKIIAVLLMLILCVSMVDSSILGVGMAQAKEVAAVEAQNVDVQNEEATTQIIMEEPEESEENGQILEQDQGEEVETILEEGQQVKITLEQEQQVDQITGEEQQVEVTGEEEQQTEVTTEINGEMNIEESTEQIEIQEQDTLNLEENMENESMITESQMDQQAGKKEISSCSFTRNTLEYYYTGKEIRPVVTVKDNDKKLTEGVEYTVSIQNNKDVGTLVYQVIGNAAYGYTGVKKITFKILPRSIASAKVTTKADSFAYNGREQKLTLIHEGRTLVEGKDYTAVYTNNINMGKATAVFQGIGNYSGKRTVNFSIVPRKADNFKVESSKKAVKLSWDWVNRKAVTGFRVYRSTDGVKFECIEEIPIGSGNLSYTDSSIILGKTYYYRVRGYFVDSSQKKYYGTYTGKKEIIVPMDKVTGVTASFEDYQSAKIIWKKVSGVYGYRVYHSTDMKNYELVKELTGEDTLTYTDQNLKAGVKYYYRVRAYTKDENNKKYYGPNSNRVGITIQPRKVKDFKVTLVDENNLKFSWTKTVGAQGYKLYRSLDGKNFEQVVDIQDGEAVSYTDEGLGYSTTYYYKIKSYIKVDDVYYYGSDSEQVKQKTEGKPKVIVLDPGHGGSDTGAIGTLDGEEIREKNLTLQIVQAAKTYFDKDSRFKVYYTRLDDVTLTLKNRTDLAKEVDADAFVSVHINNFNGVASGTETLYNPDRPNEKNGLTTLELATIAQKNMVAATGFRDRGLVQRTGLYVLNQTSMPACLIEVGFLSNAQETQMMVQPDNIQKYAKAVYDTVIEATKVE